jgi:AcrR family transcriptional regulator
MPVGRRRSLRSDVTRDALLRVARRQFAKRGYAGSSADEIAQEAGVTRGTLYYQYRDKRALFAAVCDQLEYECVERIRAAASPASGLWSRLHAGCAATLDLFLDPVYRRIVVVEGPAVLGWEDWRKLMSKYGRSLLREGFKAAMDQGLIDRQPISPLVDAFLGAINEAGLAIAHTKHVGATRRQFGLVIARLLEGLRVKEETPWQ